MRYINTDSHHAQTGGELWCTGTAMRGTCAREIRSMRVSVPKKYCDTDTIRGESGPSPWEKPRCWVRIDVYFRKSIN